MTKKTKQAGEKVIFIQKKKDKDSTKFLVKNNACEKIMEQYLQSTGDGKPI